MAQDRTKITADCSGCRAQGGSVKKVSLVVGVVVGCRGTMVIYRIVGRRLDVQTSS